MQIHSMEPTELAPASVAVGEEISIVIGAIQYLLIPHPQKFLESDHGDSLTLLTVYVPGAGEDVSKLALQEFRTNVLDRDDVFQSEFCANFLFYGGGHGEPKVVPDAQKELEAWGTKHWTSSKGNTAIKVSPGPYVLLRGRIWQPWRIYRDFNTTFITFLTLDAPEAGTNGRVVVPSRCYFQKSKERPLAGARISVKDNIDVAGHKTTLCNRAWEELYPAKTKTAACVQTLIDAGAVIVGKTKLQAMIMREEPKEAIEFTAPFNPRGDGYQVPSGSSHGSAASIGSYDWLDYSFGSDTNGSGRKPAHYNGCFSIRPSTGIMNTDGVIGQFPQFDMPVFFGRDLSTFTDFISVWYGDSTKLRAPPKSPIRILYPTDYLPTSNAAQSSLIEKFVKGLESAFNIDRETISLRELWNKQTPDGPENSDLAEYLELAGGYPYYRDSYYDLEGFRTEYEKAYGKPPFVQRAMHWQWNIAKTISRDERDKYWRRSEIYRKWLLDKVFLAAVEDSTSIMIFPIEVGAPNYREADIPPFSILSGYSSLNMSPMMRAPELTTILGEIPYESIVTKRDEPLPIGASVIGPPGADLILVDLIMRGMEAGGFPLKVKTGRYVH